MIRSLINRLLYWRAWTTPSAAVYYKKLARYRWVGTYTSYVPVGDARGSLGVIRILTTEIMLRQVGLRIAEKNDKPIACYLTPVQHGAKHSAESHGYKVAINS